MAITGRSVPNHPIVITAQGVQVVGTQAIVVTSQPPRRVFVYNKGTNAQGSGEFKESPQINRAYSQRPDSRYLRVNHPLTSQGSGVVTDVSPDPQPIVVANPVPAVWRRVNRPLLASDLGAPEPGPTLIFDAPVDRRYLRVYPAAIVGALGEQVTGTQALVVAAPRRKLLAPQPIIIGAPLEAPATPASPPTVPIVMPGPNPHRLTKGPVVVTGVEGNPAPPPTPADVDWCAQSPVTGWTAQSPFTDWDVDTPLTNWMSITPEEDC